MQALLRMPSGLRADLNYLFSLTMYYAFMSMSLLLVVEALNLCNRTVSTGYRYLSNLCLP